MTYNKLESATRGAACRTLGTKSKEFDRWLVICDPNEDIDIEGVASGTSVEFAIHPFVSPFTCFSSVVSVFVSLGEEQGRGDVQVFFGDSCGNTEAALTAAQGFLLRDKTDGWYVEDDFEDNSGLHLMHTFAYDPENERSMAEAIASCFAELLEMETDDQLRSFIRYFED